MQIRHQIDRGPKLHPARLLGDDNARDGFNAFTLLQPEGDRRAATATRSEDDRLFGDPLAIHASLERTRSHILIWNGWTLRSAALCGYIVGTQRGGGKQKRRQAARHVFPLKAPTPDA